MSEPSPLRLRNSTNRIASAAILLMITLATIQIIRVQDLWFSDEPRVAGIAVQMADRHFYSVPYLGKVPFVEKPPLYFASAALAYRLTGSDVDPAITFRLVSLSWGLLTLAATALLAITLLQREQAGAAPARELREAAWATAAVALCSPGFISNALTIRVDIALACCVVATLLCACRWVFYQRPIDLYLGALGLSLTFLAKGIIGPALVAVSLLALLPELIGLGWDHWHRQARHYLLASALFLLPALLWLTLLYRHGGTELLSVWFLDNHVGRFQGGGDLWHEEPGNYTYYWRSVYQYLALWLVPLLLWLALCAKSLLQQRTLRCADRIPLLALAGMITLLSIATTKRPVYLLPALPLFVLGIAISLCRAQTARFLPWARGLGLLCLSLVAVLSVLALLPLSLPALDPYLAQLSPLGASLFLAASMALIVLTPQVPSSWRCIAIGQALLLLVLAYAHIPVSNLNDGRHDELQAFLAPIEDRVLERTAMYPRVLENMQGYLYAYRQRSFDQLGAQEMSAVLRGEHARYDCVLLYGEPKRVLPPHRLISVIDGGRKFAAMSLHCRETLSE